MATHLELLPSDLRKELRKFICPYTVQIKESKDAFRVILRFTDSKNTINLQRTEYNRESLYRMLEIVSHPNLMKEDRWYLEPFNNHDYKLMFDDAELCLLLRGDYKVFKVPICRVLVDALAFVAKSLPGTCSLGNVVVEY